MVIPGNSWEILRKFPKTVCKMTSSNMSLLVSVTFRQICFKFFIYASGSAYLPAKTIAFKSVSRTKNKNGLLMSTVLGRDREALRATNSIEDAAAPTVPSLVTSIVALCLTLPTLRGSSRMILSNSPRSKGASMYN